MTSFLRLRFDCHVSQDEKIVFLCVCFLKKTTLTLYKIFCDFLVCSFLEAITLIKILPIQRQTPWQHFKSCLDALELSSRCFFLSNPSQIKKANKVMCIQAKLIKGKTYLKFINQNFVFQNHFTLFTFYPNNIRKCLHNFIVYSFYYRSWSV